VVELKRGSLTRSAVQCEAYLRSMDFRADHVDILGASPLNAAILKIAAGRGDLVKQQIGSDILDYVEKMKWD
jgi:phospholipid:diacylglycerol acyltransferase